MALDASTAAAVAALSVACLALVIALAQVMQQYFITGQLIRLCDSVVFGPLPGQGRRIWQLSQFRFRVVYSIPQISLDASLWPEESPHIRSYAVGKSELPRLGIGTVDVLKEEEQADEEESWLPSAYDTSVKRRPRFRFAKKRRSSQTAASTNPKPGFSDRRVGEAAWVSFCRATERPCGDSVRFDFVEHDADRCPPDLVTAPMQVSMRDVIVMGLMAGMEMTSCSFKEKSVSMQGEVGTITSSNHPTLGPILHFTPRGIERPPSSALNIRSPRSRGVVEERWLARTWNVCVVAQKYFHSGKRRTTRRLDERWISDRTGLSFTELSRADDPGEPDRRGRSHEGLSKHKKSESNADENDGPATSRGRVIKREPIRRYPQDGPWTITTPPEPPRAMNAREKGNEEKVNSVPNTAAESPKAPTREAALHGEPGYPRPKRQATVEDYAEDESIQINDHQEEGPNSLRASDSETLDRVQTARIRQAARGVRLREIQRDKSLVAESVKKGAMLSPYQPTTLLLMQHPHNPQQDTASEEQAPEPTTEEEAARQREEERQRLRRERDAERIKRNDAHRGTTYLYKVDMFWMCQLDIFRGYWATPWQHVDDVPLQAANVGAVTVILETLLGFLDDKSLIYTGSCSPSYVSFQDTARWLLDGNSTYPAYAVNARGGVISKGVYHGVRIPAFRPTTVVPALELLYSYEWQVNPEVRDQTRFGEEQNVELMRLDSWLSYVGRTDEIGQGPNRLLKQTPALVTALVDRFEDDFQNTDLSASAGGLQDIQGLAANVMDFLTDEELTEAEQLYVLIALLRAVKVGQSVLAGADTYELHDILVKDVQVHLV